MNFTSLTAAQELQRHLLAKMEGYIASGRMDANKRPAAEAIVAKMVAEVEQKPEAWFDTINLTGEQIELHYHGKI